MRAFVSWKLGADLGNLEIQGAAGLSATGSSLANAIKGNAGANTIDGGGGGGGGGGAASGSAGSQYRKAAPANTAPVISHAIAGQQVAEDGAWSFALHSDTFADSDGTPLAPAATLADGTSLPSWPTFDAVSGRFNGTPPLNFNGVTDLRVTASDGALSASDDFQLTIRARPDDIVQTNAIADKTIDDDSAWSFTVPAGTLVDPDGAPVTYDAVLKDGGRLPSWLSFDQATGRFTGTPPLNDHGSLDTRRRRGFRPDPLQSRRRLQRRG